MKQLSKHDVNRLSVSKLKSMLPFELTSDDEVIAQVIPVHDVNKLTELPFDKTKQAKHTW